MWFRSSFTWLSSFQCSFSWTGPRIFIVHSLSLFLVRISLYLSLSTLVSLPFSLSQSLSFTLVRLYLRRSLSLFLSSLFQRVLFLLSLPRPIRNKWVRLSHSFSYNLGLFFQNSFLNLWILFSSPPLEFLFTVLSERLKTLSTYKVLHLISKTKIRDLPFFDWDFFSQKKASLKKKDRASHFLFSR